MKSPISVRLFDCSVPRTIVALSAKDDRLCLVQETTIVPHQTTLFVVKQSSFFPQISPLRKVTTVSFLAQKVPL